MTAHRARRGVSLLVASALITAIIPGIALAQGFAVTFSAGQKTLAPGGVLPPLTGTITDAVAPTATVTFGDGTSAIVPVTAVPGTPGAFSFLVPDHTYSANGNFLLKVAVTDQGVTQQVQTTVQVFGVGGGGGSGGGGGTGFVQPLISSLTAAPAQIVVGQTVTFTAQISNLPTPDWNWLWQFGFGAATIVAPGAGSATKTTTYVFTQPGTYFVQFTTDTTPPAGGFDPTSSLTVQVFGRTEAVAVDCGTPIFGLPTTLTATITDTSDPASAAAALSARTIQFVVNGNPVGSPQPVTLTSPTTAVATLQYTVTTLPGQAITCSGFVADNALVTLRDATGAIVGLTATVLPPGVPQLLPVGTIIDPAGNFITPGGTFPPFGGFPPASALVLSAIGKVTGGVRLADGTRSSFEVQSKDGRTVNGNLEYKSATTEFKATSFLGLGISADGRIAIFAGTGTTGGKSPSTVRFLVKVTDNGEPGTHDTFVISFDGGTTFLPAGVDGGKLVGGNIQIHPGK